jgi:hypothetical protein
VWIAPALALGVMAFQVLFAWALSGEHRFSKAYQRLGQWDTAYYAWVVDRGYQGPVPPTRQDAGNFAFFPGYPLSGWLLHRATGLPTTAALVAAAQLACWAFWTYTFLFFRRWRAPLVPALFGVLLIVSHPAAFFLTAGYSEPLFLAGLCGFLYWSGKESRAAPWLAAAHGLVMTATRWVGFPLVCYPLLHAWSNRPAARAPGLRAYAAPLAVGAVAALGALLFFAYCHFRFGQWDLYMKSNEAGWHTHANYLGFFSYKTYKFGWHAWRDGFLDPDWFCHLCLPVYLAVFGFVLIRERRRSNAPTGLGGRLGFYVCAALMFYVAVCARADCFLSCLVRFVLPVEAMLSLALVQWLSGAGAAGGCRRAWLWAILVARIVVGFIVQAAFSHRFLHGGWVA